jgi:hypothetical protein
MPDATKTPFGVMRLPRNSRQNGRNWFRSMGQTAVSLPPCPLPVWRVVDGCCSLAAGVKVQHIILA